MPKKIDEATTRRERLAQIQKLGIPAYPAKSERSHTIAELACDAENILKKKASVIIVGRLRSVRAHGGSTFAHLEDGTGSFQIYLKQDEVGDEAYERFASLIDVGDFVQATGTLFTTKRGENTVLVSTWNLLAKAISPLPETWHGLPDVEIRFRKRYLDLVSNPDVREVFVKRAKAVAAIRDFLNKHEYLEVETPLLQPIPGGANARPFVTHHNALDQDLYLQIAPELYLKRLIIGGYERVYTITRCFRNEGIDWSHNPEFSMLEFYQAYMDYEGMMDFTEDLVISIVKAVSATNTITYQGEKITFKKPFKRITFRQLLIDYAHVDIEDYPDQKSMYQKTQELKLKDARKNDNRGKLCDEIYKEFARPKLIQPTFMIDHPVELSPLSKKKPNDERYVERLQLVAGGMEMVNAFSELNDPVDQLARFQDQQKNAKAGDEEAHPIDMDYIEALEHGMPPTAGLGMGIDRLTGLLTDRKNIKEVILFPTLRTKEEEA